MWTRIEGRRAMELATPGEMRTRLNALVLAGQKVATAGLHQQDYVDENEELDRIGELMPLVDDDLEPIALLEITDVQRVRFADVTWAFAQAEGEGFTSIEHWRDAHRRYWTGAGVAVDDDTEVVCVWMRLVNER